MARFWSPITAVVTAAGLWPKRQGRAGAGWPIAAPGTRCGAASRRATAPTRSRGMLADGGRWWRQGVGRWRDGWRDMGFLLLVSPRWLFFYPGLAMLLVGVVAGLAIIPGPLSIGSVKLDVDTLAGASALMIIGIQLVLFAIFTSVYASNEGFLPPSKAVNRLLRVWTLEPGSACGAALGVAGVAGVIASLVIWSGASFGRLPYDSVLRVVLPSATALIASCQLVFGTFFLSILGIRRSARGLGADMQAGVDSLLRELDGAAEPGVLRLSELAIQGGQSPGMAAGVIGLQVAGQRLTAEPGTARPARSRHRAPRSARRKGT